MWHFTSLKASPNQYYSISVSSLIESCIHCHLVEQSASCSCWSSDLLLGSTWRDFSDVSHWIDLDAPDLEIELYSSLARTVLGFFLSLEHNCLALVKVLYPYLASDLGYCQSHNRLVLTSNWILNSCCFQGRLALNNRIAIDFALNWALVCSNCNIASRSISYNYTTEGTGCLKNTDFKFNFAYTCWIKYFR